MAGKRIVDVGQREEGKGKERRRGGWWRVMRCYFISNEVRLLDPCNSCSRTERAINRVILVLFNLCLWSGDEILSVHRCLHEYYYVESSGVETSDTRSVTVNTESGIRVGTSKVRDLERSTEYNTRYFLNMLSG